jgi:hypothetical protein
VARTPHTVDVEFMEKGAHDKSDFLRQLIQSKIDSAQCGDKKYDAILLCYGLCGNGAVNIESGDMRVVIPRAHDCCTIFLGSKDRFRQYFADNPSLPFSSTGYMERGGSYVREASIERILGLDKSYGEYVRLYGEDNARYIFETLNPVLTGEQERKVVFVDIPETRHLGYAEKCRAKAQAEGKEYVQLQGDIRLIRNLVFGEWNSDDFLVMTPHQRTAGAYDWDEIIRAEDATEG